jgi:tetratricopeptide (TPR) repeat protein
MNRLPAAAQCDRTLPEVPADTYAYQRARREELCAELSASAYDDEPLTIDGVARFTSPVPNSGRKAILLAFGYVENGVGYLSFRGTVPRILRNWLTDCHVAPTGRPRRHRGFDVGWKRLRPQILAWLANQRPRELILTGHSLGGAMAQLAAMELAAAWPIRAVVCFGAPLVGWRAFTAAYDATPIHDRPGTKLGAVTTTYVFKSDLVRTLLLPALGFKRNGREIVIDEHGRMSDAFRPWYADALNKGFVPLVWLGLGFEAIAGGASPAYGFDHFAAGRAIAPSPSPFDLNRDGRVDWRDLETAAKFARPVAQAILPAVGHWIMMALAGVTALCALIATFLSVKFVGRDATYHSVRKRYVRAMGERVEQWIPLAYEERGNDLLAKEDPKGALTYLDAALACYEREGRAIGLSGSALCQYAGAPRISRAIALIEAGDYDQAIADLSTLIESYPQTRIVIPISASGAFAFPPRVLALRQRAIAFQRNRQFREAMADYAVLLSAGSDLPFEEFSHLRATARRNAGARERAVRVARTLLGRQNVDGEVSSLYQASFQPVKEALAKQAAWAHYQRGLCASELKDFSAVIVEATAGIALNERDAWAYNLRGAAHWKLHESEEAFADLGRSIELEPGIAGFWFARAKARLFPEAKMKVEGKTMGKVLINLSLTRGDLEAIELDLAKTLELDPSNVTAREWLEDLRKASGSNAATG